MYQLETAIARQLASALPAAWKVLADATATGERRTTPMAVCQLGAAEVGPAPSNAVQLQPQIGIHLLVRKGPQSVPEQIDAAVAATIACLHGWAPGEVAGRRWERLKLRQISVPEQADDGLAGCLLIFTTAGKYSGIPDSF